MNRSCRFSNNRDKILAQATSFQNRGTYPEARDLYLRAIDISRKTGIGERDEYVYGNLGIVLCCLGEYVKAEEHLRKALDFSKEIRDRQGEASAYANLGIVHQSVGQYSKAEEYFQKALWIMKETDERRGEASAYGNLAILYQSISQYTKAKGYAQKADLLSKETGESLGEASAYGNLGIVFQSTGQYSKAHEYLQKAVLMSRETGDRRAEASAYGNLGIVFKSTGKYSKAKEYLEEALAMSQELGHKQGEASACEHLGTVFQSTGEYSKAKEYLEKALEMSKEMGDSQGEASAYGNLGNLLHSVGEYLKAEHYLVRALAIAKEVNDKKGEASALANLGTVFHSLGLYNKAIQYHAEALVIRETISDKKGVASSLANLGTAWHCIGEHSKAKEYLDKALEISLEIGDRNGEASAYCNLAAVFQYLREEKSKSEEYYQKGLVISNYIGDNEKQFQCLFDLAWLKFLAGNMREAISYLHRSVTKLEDLRNTLGDNDQLKISFLHERDYSYWMFGVLLYAVGNTQEALHVSMLGRSRALADLLSALYAVQIPISANPESWNGIESVMKKERNSTCLYFSSSPGHLLCWVLKGSGDISFRRTDFDESDWSVCGTSCGFFTELPSPHSFAVYRLVDEEMEEEEDIEQLRPSLSQCYQIMIAPVSDLLHDPEIIIVPDRAMYKIPFAALRDENGRYLSDTFRIRLVPSLITLKLIQDSPPGYHSETGALIVGDPDVGDVLYKGHLEKLFPLSGARKEAKMIGQLLGITPMVGGLATKREVLERIHSVSLIHFATHCLVSSAGSGIALAPRPSIIGLPQEEDYLLTVSEISKVRLRAKLVVLSCCHGTEEQIGPEGVDGVTRAFLGAGARSVLVAQGPLDDTKTAHLMSRFYKHLAHGESASESLHQAMKWMRENGYSEERDWAKFVLIGDNVTFEFDAKVSCMFIDDLFIKRV